MKCINIPVYINRFILGVTALLYLTVFYGLYAQIVLGGFQLITGLVLLFLFQKLSEEQVKKLVIYWLVVGIYGVLCFMKLLYPYFNFWIVFVIIPLSIAGYFTFILESLKSKK